MESKINQYTIENVKDMNGSVEVDYYRIKLNDNLYYGGYTPEHIITSEVGFESRIKEIKYAEYFVLILKEYYDKQGNRNNKEFNEEHSPENFFA